jgi:hypothetical protein
MGPTYTSVLSCKVDFDLCTVVQDEMMDCALQQVWAVCVRTVAQCVLPCWGLLCVLAVSVPLSICATFVCPQPAHGGTE